MDKHDPLGPFPLTGSVGPKGTGVHTGAGRINDRLDAVVITTGSEAYRRADGIAVVPAALLRA